MTPPPVPGLSIFVPLLDEAPILEANAARILAWGREWSGRTRRPFEILLASNGSRDATEEICARLARATPEEIRCVFLSERGVGRALRAAIPLARYDRFVTVDADLSVDLAFVGEAEAALCGRDMVVGSKHTGRQSRPILRRVGSWLFLALVERSTGLPFTDYSIGAKGFRTAFLRAHLGVIDDVTGFALPLAAAAVRAGGAVEIPILCEDHRASKFGLVREGFYRFAHLARFLRARSPSE